MNFSELDMVLTLWVYLDIYVNKKIGYLQWDVESVDELTAQTVQ